MIGTIERHGLADLGGAGDHGPSRVKARVPGSCRQFAGKLGARAVAVARRWDFPPSRARRCRARRPASASVMRQPDRGDIEQRHLLQAQPGNRHQRQRRQKEQRDAPIGLHIDREEQAAERRPDRDHDLDDPDIERLRPVHAGVRAARPDRVPTPPTGAPGRPGKRERGQRHRHGEQRQIMPT